MNKRRAAIFCVFLFLQCSLLTVPCFSQDRSRMAVFVAPPTGGGVTDRDYFLEQFRMELIGANYPSVETKEESAYTLFLNISENENYDPRYKIDDTNRPWLLGIRLVNSKDDTEIVSFNFAYVNTDQMADWNLYLLYQALANAYVSGDTPPPAAAPSGPVDDRWRDQFFYINAGLGADFGSFIHSKNNRIAGGYLLPMVFAGFEWHFLSFLSLEAGLKARLIDNNGDFSYSAAAPVLVKGVLKPSGVMLELYAGLEPALSLDSFKIPALSFIAGVQLGGRATERSAWVLDVGLTRNFLGQITYSSGDYNLLRVHIAAGYKFGFKDRPAPKTQANQAESQK